ncbi:uncharacterized protein LOC121859044, partial [Homarus americanus]|uniref:uncharacterized protein LOC121859044 n=1 Tax=Homarus americanus TaxID=6706 RepID=UPI001C482C31
VTSKETAAKLLAIIAHVEAGDYQPYHTANYLKARYPLPKKFKINKQVPFIAEKAVHHYLALRGMSKEEAQRKFLNIIQRQRYGVETIIYKYKYFPECNLGFVFTVCQITFIRSGFVINITATLIKIISSVLSWLIERSELATIETRD